MSAPETNTQRQERRHRPALIGIAAALVLAAVAAIIMAFFSVPSSEQAAPDLVPPESGAQRSE